MMRHALRALATAAFVLTALSAQAKQTNPSRPVRVVVPFAAGGPLDIVARGVADKRRLSLKQPFVMENRVGAGGNIGAESAAKATAGRLYAADDACDRAYRQSIALQPSLRSAADGFPGAVRHGQFQPDDGGASFDPGAHLADSSPSPRKNRSPMPMPGRVAAATLAMEYSRPSPASRPCRCHTGAMLRWSSIWSAGQVKAGSSPPPAWSSTCATAG